MKPIPDRAANYLKTMPFSVQGQGGHAALFEAAATLTRGFALSAEAALPLLLHWNSGCLPPWPESDLRQTLRSAATASTRAEGYLLHDQSSSSSYSSSSSRKAKSKSKSKPSSEVRSEKSEVLSPEAGTEAAKKARLREAWPEFHPLTQAAIRSIAEQRHLLPDAVDLAHRWGFLKTATLDGIDCFILHEGSFAQARRLDGKPFIRPGGTPIKTKNLAGSEGAFIGRRWLGQTRNVLLVEGVVGLLEALAALALVDTRESWSLLAATSASSRFARDPKLLQSLRDRHVRIIPDADETGMKAATTWAADLRTAGARVSLMSLPPGFPDLGPLVVPEAALSGSHDADLRGLFA